MDQNLIYAKTPIGDEAVRQSTRVVQRNLRMVLVQVDGKLTVAELAAKIGNVKLVEAALRELDEGGFIAPIQAASSVWEESKQRAQQIKVSAISQFSTFGPKSVGNAGQASEDAPGSAFSTFGKPILPVPPGPVEVEPAVQKEVIPESAHERHPLPVKKIFAGLAGLLILVIAVLLLFPYDRFRPEIEAALGNTLQTTVRVGGVRLTLLPRQLLVVSDIRIGDKGESRIAELRLPSPLSLLLSGGTTLTQVEVSDLSMDADRLAIFSGATAGPALRRVSVERMTITAGDLSLGKLSGDILFQTNRQVEKAFFQTVDRDLRLEAIPTPQGVLLNIEAYGWRPVSDKPVAFESMQAKGLLQRGKLVIQNFDTTFFGGILKGSWLLDWSNGLVMAGDANLARLDLPRLATVFAPSLKLDGELAGNLRLRGAGRDWAALWDNVDATLDATVSHGIFHGVDLGEATRRGSGYVVRSGNTKFETLQAEVVLTPLLFSAKNLQLNAGMMSATGQFSSPRNRSIEGNFVVTMQSSVTRLRVPVKVSGDLPDLVAVSGR